MTIATPSNAQILLGIANIIALCISTKEFCVIFTLLGFPGANTQVNAVDLWLKLVNSGMYGYCNLLECKNIVRDCKYHCLVHKKKGIMCDIHLLGLPGANTQVDAVD